jgi:hypothetical protein
MITLKREIKETLETVYDTKKDKQLRQSDPCTTLLHAVLD